MTATTGQDCLLFVDDDHDIRETVSLVLGSAGYAVLTAADGREALEVLRGGARPRVILLDLMMPGMNGWQFRAEQAQDPALSTIPVVVMSGHAQAEEEARALGISAGLKKPIDLELLLGIVKRYCRGHDGARAPLERGS